MKLEQAAFEVVERLQQAGFTAYWAGGCVRDRLLGQEPKDFDVATDASPTQVEGLFERTHHIGSAFMVSQVMLKGHAFELAAFRREAEYYDGRHPSKVEASSPEEDAARRDFTINGMFYDPVAGKLIDFVGGEADLRAGVVRAIGDAAERFREDHLRMLRAVRFASTFAFVIEAKTLEAIRRHASEIGAISAERVRDECTRMLMEAQRAGEGFRLLHDCGLLQHILPEAIPMIGCEQPPQWHPEGDVFTHTALMLDLLEERTLELVWSVVLHDIGKPPTAVLSDEPDGSRRWRFNGHAEVGAEMAEEILRRLKFSNDEIKAVVTCVRHHMDFMNVPKMKRHTLRKMAGRPTFATEMALHKVDCLGSFGDLGHYTFMQDFLKELANEPVLPEPLVTGRDLMELGFEPGPVLGQAKQAAFDQQLSDAGLDKEALLRWLQQTWRPDAE